MLNYGLVGLGNLGEKIARNLIKKGFVVKVFDKDQAKINELTKIGAIASLSPAQAAEDVDGLITCLPSPKISTEVMIGEDGAIGKMKQGSTWIETSTTDIKDLQLVAKIAGKQNIKTIEAPVTGGVHRAEKGIITVLVGAEKENFLDQSQIKILSLNESKNSYDLVFTEPEFTGQGKIKLYFNKNTYELFEWQIEDFEGNWTAISLHNIERNIALTNSLFYFKKPR